MLQLLPLIPVLLVVASISALVTWLVNKPAVVGANARLVEREREVAIAREEVSTLRDDLARTRQERDRLCGAVEAERAACAEKATLLEEAKVQLRDAFALASKEALRSNNEVFLSLAETRLAAVQQSAQSELAERQQSIDRLVKPVAEGLQAVGERLTAFDRDRAVADATLQEQLRTMASGQAALAGETQTLVQALKTPHVRGRWGEIQLKRVVEMAGMLEHCDFNEQQSIHTEGGRLRPDLLVRLPGHKVVVVDAKAPLSAYLESLDAKDEARRNDLLAQHARQVRDHVVALSTKDYANEFTESPDFVVMFLPGESFFSAACQHDPSLIEFATRLRVIPASPTTLITVLMSINYGWQQERIARNAEEIRDLGQTLYERIRSAAEHLCKVRKGLEAAVNGYNGAIGALESRVLPAARRFRDLGAGSGEEIAVLEPVDTTPRRLSSADFVELDAA